MDLLAAEITARTGKDPGEHYKELTAQFGMPFYTRVDAPATPAQKSRLRELPPEAVTAAILAGEPIIAKLTRAPGDNAPIGGLKVVSANGWFAARPSGTENICKIYAESFKDEAHLNAIQSEAEGIVNNALNSSRAGAAAPMGQHGNQGSQGVRRPLYQGPRRTVHGEYHAGGNLESARRSRRSLYDPSG